MRMAQRLSDSLCASMTFPDLRRLRERNERQGCGGGASVLTLHSAPLCCSSIILLPCGVSHTGKRTSRVMTASSVLARAQCKDSSGSQEWELSTLDIDARSTVLLWIG
jgi:hypothetical protein